MWPSWTLKSQPRRSIVIMSKGSDFNDGKIIVGAESFRDQHQQNTGINVVVDSGAGVGDSSMQTPAASFINNEYEQRYGDVSIDMSQVRERNNPSPQIYDQNLLSSSSIFTTNSNIGTPSLPVSVRLVPDEKNQVEKILQYVKIGSSILFIIIMLLFLFSGGPRTDSLHQLILKCPVRFDDVQGCDEVKDQMIEIVDFLKNPEKFEKFGAAMPRGYLLEGPPGVGKTMLAKAVAGEAKVPFLSISGAEFEQMYVGVGAARVRELFKDARSHHKAVIFIDEIDAVGGKRSSHGDSSHSRQTINQLLVEMDGFKSGTSIVVLAATNTVQSLDTALLRPGRFDKTLSISPPDINGRTKIIDSLLRKIPENVLDQNVNAAELAASTIGYTGATLAFLVNQAKILASLDKNSKVITKKHFTQAMHNINLGPEKKNMALSDIDKERTAYHEAGHAIVGLATLDCYPVHYATIVPHSNALGLVLSAPEKDVVSVSKKELESRIDLALGGFLAEAKKYGTKNVSTGASSDLATANAIAKQMVESGFGILTGFYQLSNDSSRTSETAKVKFEEDVMNFLNESKKRVNLLLTDQKKAWEAIAGKLIAVERINKSELIELYEANRNKDSTTEKEYKIYRESEQN